MGCHAVSNVFTHVPENRCASETSITIHYSAWRNSAKDLNVSIKPVVTLMLYFYE